MKFKNLIIILFLFSCAPGSINKENPNYIPYTAKGFVMIFDEIDYKKNKISVKLNNKEFQIAHNTIKKNSNVIITNPQNNKSITLKVYKKSKQPDFFKAIITKKVSDFLLLNPEFPYVDIQERAKNKSFVAKKAVTFSEEQNVLIKAPVTKVKIDNISKKENKVDKKKRKYSIIIGVFYSQDSVDNLVDLLVNEGIKKEDFFVKKLKKNKYQLSAGPYSSINALKNDYFKLNKYGFDNLDLKQND